MTKPAKFIGRSVPRLEDRPLLLGQGRFAADINFPGQWHMRVVRSPVAHGKLRKIDASAALKLPGVHAVWTYADVAHIPPIGFRLTGLVELEPYRQYALATDTVRYVGEPVAAVFADDPYIAEDAAELVALDIEPLPVVLDAAGPPGPFDDERNTEATVIEKKSGDVEAALRAAHAIVELDLSIGRHSGVPLETRGLIARYVESHGRAGNVRRRQSAALESATAWRSCSGENLRAFSYLRVMSAAASASAARCIRKTCWCARPR